MKEVEELLLDQQKKFVEGLGVKTERPHKYVFTPSGASKCKRELYYKLMKETPKEEKYAYHKRWTRNATAVHEAIQKDLLYSEALISNPRFKVHRKDGLPAWEENIKHPVILEHNGKEFALLGMMDGVLEYKDGSIIGLEIKTKSTTIASVGTYLLKKPSDSHLIQATAYSILFGIDEYIFLYTNNDSIVQRNKTRGKELSKTWIDTSFTDYQNEFYETVSKKIPNSRRISTAGKDKMYVSRIIAQILNVQELTDRNI